MAPLDLGLTALQSAYREGRLSPAQVVELLYPALQAATYPASPIFTHLASKEQLVAAARALEAVPADSRGPLWGVPCAVKDNVDVRGMPTTAACPAFSYAPDASAVGVKALEDAGEEWCCCWAGEMAMHDSAARAPYRSPSSACAAVQASSSWARPTWTSSQRAW